MSDTQRTKGITPRSEELFRLIAENVEDFAIKELQGNPRDRKTLGHLLLSPSP